MDWQSLKPLVLQEFFMCDIAQNGSGEDILALTKLLYGIGKKRIATGQDVSQENIATLNRTRDAIREFESQSNGGKKHGND
jgi:hypothetical protein